MSKAVLDNVDTLFSAKDGRRTDKGDGGGGGGEEEDDAAEEANHKGTAAKVALNEFIDREINMRMTKSVTWKNLESCFKWARVQEYLSEQDIDVDDPVVGRLRGMLKANQLGNVQYSTRTRKIIKLNTENM
jgi:hypothetical protein